MAADAKSARTKITYATMTADRMEDLHRELDRAIEQVPSTFGRSYPLLIGGQVVRRQVQIAQSVFRLDRDNAVVEKNRGQRIAILSGVARVEQHVMAGNSRFAQHCDA